MCGWESQILARHKWKSSVKSRKTVITPGKLVAIVPIFPWKDRSPFLHILDPNYLSFYLKCPRKWQKTYNFNISPTLYQICTSPLLNFGVDLKFDHIPLCVYYYCWIMQGLVFLTYFSNVIEEKPLGVDSKFPPPPS